jgi:hypothetical protein
MDIRNHKQITIDDIRLEFDRIRIEANTTDINHELSRLISELASSMYLICIEIKKIETKAILGF